MSKSKELKTITRCHEVLQGTFRNNLNAIAQFMRTKEIIAKKVWSEVTDLQSRYSKDERAQLLLREWEDKVEEDLSLYVEVVENHFRQSPEHYKTILFKLDEEYRKQGGSPGCRQNPGEFVVLFPLMSGALARGGANEQLLPPPPTPFGSIFFTHLTIITGINSWILNSLFQW